MSIFAAIPVLLLVAAGATFLAILRDVKPHLEAEHRYALRRQFDNTTFRQLRAGDKAIGRAWRIQTSLFPTSRKRAMFAAFVIAAALSVLTYPLWFAYR